MYRVKKIYNVQMDRGPELIKLAREARERFWKSIGMDFPEEIGDTDYSIAAMVLVAVYEEYSDSDWLPEDTVSVVSYLTEEIDGPDLF